MIVFPKANVSPFARGEWPRRSAFLLLTSIDRYFFHTTSARAIDKDYYLKDEGDEQGSTSAVNNKDQSQVEHDIEEPETVDDGDSTLAQWFKVDADPATSQATPIKQSDSETDPDSDYRGHNNQADGDDDWMQIKYSGNEEEPGEMVSRAYFPVWVS